jgi:hypothetical protein
METLIRHSNDSTDRDLIFQTLDWHCEDIENKYTIYVFGIDIEGVPVNLEIKDFYPFFFIEVPITWTRDCIYSVRESLNFKGKSIEFL